MNSPDKTFCSRNPRVRFVLFCVVAAVIMSAGQAGCGGKPDIVMDIGGVDVAVQDSVSGADDSPLTDAAADADTTVDVACDGNTDCSGLKPWCHIASGVCVECLNHVDCGGAGFCQEGFVCGATPCVPSARSCDGNVAKVCSADGKSLVETNCSLDDRICSDGSCFNCLPLLGECVSGNIARRCRADGSGWDEETCSGGLVCANGECLVCVPGQKSCAGSTDVVLCTLDGTGFVHQTDCWEQKRGDVCLMGRCVNLCEQKTANPTNLGCHFVAIDMEQYKDSEPPYYGENAPFAVVIANGHEDLEATVEVFHGNTLVKSVTVPAGQSTVINLDPLNLFGVGISDNVYRIDSNLPVVAYQFNPLENVGVFSNDASLLLPIERLGHEYRIVSMPNLGLNSSNQYLGSNFAVVAVEVGVTEVTITPTTHVLAGTNTLGVKKGLSQTWTLQHGEVFNVSAEMTQFLDLTGSLVAADKKIAVFSGHPCSNAPMSTCVEGKCSYDKDITCASSSSCPVISACDHLEEQLPPLAAWGNEYVVPKTMARGLAPDLVRVVAKEDNTHISITPPVVAARTLQGGEFYEFEIDGPVVVKSDRGVLAAIILEGESAPGSAHVFCSDQLGENCTTSHHPDDCTCSDDMSACQSAADCSDDAGIGDPSLILAVPTTQFMNDYAFYVPGKYAYSYISVAVPVGAKVKLDGAGLEASAFDAVEGTSFMTAVLPVAPGLHVIDSDVGVGLYVYGWDSWVSYGYPAGMGLSWQDAE